MKPVRSMLAVSAIAGGALALSACNYDTTAATSGGTTQTTAQPVASTAGPGATAPGATAPGQMAVRAVGEIIAKNTASLGTIVTDGDGYTLYRFDKDSYKPSASHCTGACATTWPPALIRGALPRLAGINPSEEGTVTRPDGSTQLTIGGWPVYYYAPDTAPGEYKGEGVGGTWYAVTPDGKKALPAASTTPTYPPTPPTAGAGYGGNGSGGYGY